MKMEPAILVVTVFTWTLKPLCDTTKLPRYSTANCSRLTSSLQPFKAQLDRVFLNVLDFFRSDIQLCYFNKGSFSQLLIHTELWVGEQAIPPDVVRSPPGKPLSVSTWP